MRKIVCLLTCLMATIAVCGQPEAAADSLRSDSVRVDSIRPDSIRPAGRKKVAVVLSGGGAKGMAHIGALKVIERAGLPVDIVTGTSMGSLVGGLYAIGYNARSLDSLVRVQEWSYVITDKENLREQSLADREKQNTYVFSRGLTFGKRSEGDGGLITGKNLAVLFQKLCTGYTDSMDFNRLPIPFACVATNIVDNTEHDFHAGYLPRAMRASMAIPAVFSPVRIGDMVLVDGGLRNNYPADLAREMGADIIIGVTVQGPPKTATDLGGTLDILNQIIDVNCMNKYNDNLDMTDVAIRVNTDGYNAASFSTAAVDTLIRRGEEEAMRHWGELLALRAQLGVDSTFRPLRLSPLRPDVLTEKVRVTGFGFENMTRQDERFLTQKFRLERLDSIDTRGEEEITTAMRVDLFYQTASTRLVPSGDGYRLVMTAGNRKTSQLGVGFRFDNEEMVALQLNAVVPLRSTMPVSTDFTLRLGKRLMGRGEITFHPSSFTRPTLSYTFRRNDIDINNEGTRVYNIIYNHHQAMFSPVNFNVRNFNVRAGVRWDYYHYSDKLLSDPATAVTLDNAHYFSYRLQADFNSEDDWHFPTRGARFRGGYAYLTDNFSQLDGSAGLSDVSASWRKSFTLGSRFTLQPMLYGRMLFGSTLPLVFGNVAGGEWFGHCLEQQMPFAGLGYVEYVERHFAAMQLQAQQRIGGHTYLLLRTVGAQHADKLRRLFDTSTLLGVQAAFYYDTMFGPVGATLGYANRSNKPSLFINLGYEF